MFSTFKITAFSIALLLVACSGKDNFTAQRTTQFFLVDYNPAYLDVLWVVDNRSSLYSAREHLTDQSKKFFQRLDAVTTNYQMAIITSDMLKAKGKLQPLANPAILKRNFGTVEERTAIFGSTLTQVLFNLSTDAESKGFQAAETALKNYFTPRENTPLVLVFISDSDDHSELATDITDGVEHYSSIFLSLKGGNADLIRTYSINYVKLQAGDDANVKRCATRYQADIDSTNMISATVPYFQDRYFKLAEKLGGDTADLCSDFSSQIDLNGLSLKTLPNKFLLEKKAQLGSFSVDVFKGDEHFDLKWSFDEASNEIVFEKTPPEGTTIQVIYQSY